MRVIYREKREKFMPKTIKYEVGQKVTFTGYTQLDADQPELLTVGTEYTIQTVNSDGGLVVVDRDGKNGDTVFPEEVRPVEVKTKATRKTTTKTATKPEPKAKATKKPKATKATKTKATKPVTHRKTADEALTEIGTLNAPLTDSATVATILESKDMLVAAKELAVAAEETFLSLGGVLSHIYDHGCPQASWLRRQARLR
jgi:hypothetical protein